MTITITIAVITMIIIIIITITIIITTTTIIIIIIITLIVMNNADNGDIPMKTDQRVLRWWFGLVFWGVGKLEVFKLKCCFEKTWFRRSGKKICVSKNCVSSTRPKLVLYKNDVCPTPTDRLWAKGG